MDKGGMQSSGIQSLTCRCGKETSKILDFGDKEISIHFGKKKIFWCIYKDWKITKTYKQPKEWE